MGRKYKIRPISQGTYTQLGVSIPSWLKNWQEIWVEIKESGDALILESGAHDTL